MTRMAMVMTIMRTATLTMRITMTRIRKMPVTSRMSMAQVTTMCRKAPAAIIRMKARWSC